MSNALRIVFGKSGDYDLHFKIRNTPVAQRWVKRLRYKNLWPLDDPTRFYGFDSQEQEHNRSTEMIQRCIDTINNHDPIIHRPFEYTQDCLNYLHNIFERYHGLLDQQSSDYWHSAPDAVREALADLNLAVHRCESVSAGSHPRFVCTWFGMPKVEQLDIESQVKYGVQQISFGTVYLNYCEIGKTVEDLARDRDEYIGHDAFRPFSYFSADFNVQFYDRNLEELNDHVQSYIDSKQDFFQPRGIDSVHDPRALPVRFPVADLVFDGNRQNLLQQLAQRQWVHEIHIE